jgi:ribosomal protein S18 acetylase RimI-like enzyme
MLQEKTDAIKKMISPNWAIREVSSEPDWDQALTLLLSVYVDEGFTQAESAPQLFCRSRIDGHGEFLIASDTNGNVLGAVVLLSEKSGLRQIAQAGEAEFRLLGVSPKARGRGIGCELVQECLRRARSSRARRMVLSTQTTMLAAQRLYERLGFTRQPDRDWRISNGRQMWVYSLELD